MIMKLINKTIVGMILLNSSILSANEDVSINDLKEITYFLMKDVKENDEKINAFSASFGELENSVREKINKDLLVLNKNIISIDHKIKEMILKDYLVDRKLIEYNESK